MPLVNLRKFYPFYKSDCWQEVPQDVLDVMMAYKRADVAYQVKTYRHKAYYSLDLFGGTIEGDSLHHVPQPQEIYEQRTDYQALHKAFSTLTPTQARRVYARFVLEMTYVGIARAEGVNERTVRASIQGALSALAKKLKDIRA